MFDELSDFVMRAVTEYLRNTLLYINGTKLRQQSLPELCSVHLRMTCPSMYGNFRIKLYGSFRAFTDVRKFTEASVQLYMEVSVH